MDKFKPEKSLSRIDLKPGKVFYQAFLLSREKPEGPYVVVKGIHKLSESKIYRDIYASLAIEDVILYTDEDGIEYNLFLSDRNLAKNRISYNDNYLFGNYIDAEEWLFMERTLRAIKDGDI